MKTIEQYHALQKKCSIYSSYSINIHIRNGCCHHDNRHSNKSGSEICIVVIMLFTQLPKTMEVEVIKSFLPKLVTAISDCVQPVSDQCLAKGLTSDSVYKRVLESGGTSEDKARTLILAIKKSTETDSRCLEIFKKILEEQLPYTIRDKRLSKIRNETAEKAKTTAEVPKDVSQNIEHIPREELAKESFVLPSYLLARLEKSVREHEIQSACAEKRLLEEIQNAKSISIADSVSELTDLNTKIKQIENCRSKYTSEA